MDEPTTHLDIYAAEALAEALEGFSGTLVFVSHNTAFVNRLATKIWDVRDGTVVEYPGNLTEYLEHVARQEGVGTVAQPSPSPASPCASKPFLATKDGAANLQGESREDRRQRKRREAEKRNELGRRTKLIREAIQELEGQIGSLETTLKNLEPQLADPKLHADSANYCQVLKSYNDSRRTLEELYPRWEQRQEELDQVTAEFEQENQE
jgi:ATP-binding cassette subfamily F protein 3